MMTAWMYGKKEGRALKNHPNLGNVNVNLGNGRMTVVSIVREKGWFGRRGDLQYKNISQGC